MNALTCSLFAQGDGGGGGGMIAILVPLISLAITVFIIAGVWKAFVKAGKPGWGCIIPIYNLILILEIAGRPIWWFILLLIPFVNLIVAIIVLMDVAKRFGQGAGFGLGLFFLGFIFWPILGFGDARYQGGAAA
jgi:hypothetical protein